MPNEGFTESDHDGVDGAASGPTSLRSRLARLPQHEQQPAPFPLGQAKTPIPPVLSAPPPVATRTRPSAADVPTPTVHQQPPIERRESPADPEAMIITRRRRRWPRWIALLGILLAVMAAIPVLLAWQAYGRIERFDISSELASRETVGGDTILLIGTDSREGIDADDENAGVILGDGLGGRRSDTIMLLRIDDNGARFVSLPRDLWLPIDGGSPQRINTAIADGPAALVRTIDSELGIAVTTVAQVDLAGFMEVVDAVDGVEIVLAHPAFDRASGLDLPTAGVVELDQSQALAFVRSRRYTEIIDGVEVRDPTSDLGRVQRQQTFMRALLTKMSTERNPLALNAMSKALADAVTLDDVTSLRTAAEIANTLRSIEPESIELPTVPTTIDGKAVLVLGDEAQEVLDRLRS